jgi:pepsin A
MLATDAFNAYQIATGGMPDSATGLLEITPAQFAALKPLNFVISGVSLPTLFSVPST